MLRLSLLLYVHWVRERKDRQLCVVPTLWKEVYIDGCLWSDRLSMCIYDGSVVILCDTLRKLVFVLSL